MRQNQLTAIIRTRNGTCVTATRNARASDRQLARSTYMTFGGRNRNHKAKGKSIGDAVPESDEDTWAWRTIGPRGPVSNSKPACLCLVRTAVSFGSRCAGRRRGEPWVGDPVVTDPERASGKNNDAPNMRFSRLAPVIS